MTTVRTGARPLSLAVAVAAVVLHSSAAAAHTELLSTSLSASAPVPATTAEVVLAFSDDVRPALSTVVVTGSDGRALARGRLTAVGGRVVQPLAAPLPAGGATLAYRVLAADGHPLTGTLLFRVAGSAAGTFPGAAAAPVVRPGRGDDPAAAPDGMPAVLPVAGLGAGAGLLGLLLVRRRTSRP